MSGAAELTAGYRTTSVTMTHSPSSDRNWGLPDPYTQPEFYNDVPSKRLFAWVIDSILIALVVMLLTVLSVFTALFVLPLVWLAVGFAYRWITIASRSATPGMRLVSIELRRADGSRFDGTTALLHTAGYTFSVVTFPLQLISIAMMLMTERKQGLSDMILGTAAINRPAE